MIRLTAKQREVLVMQFKRGASTDILRISWNLSRKQVEDIIREELKKQGEDGGRHQWFAHYF